MSVYTNLRTKKRLWALVALIVLSGSRWVLNDTLPQTRSTFASSAVACMLLAVGGAGYVFLQRHTPHSVAFPRASFTLLVQAFLCGAVLLVAPAFGSVLHDAAAEPLNRVIAFCFAPLLVWMILRAQNTRGQEDIQNGGEEEMFLPTLAAIAGALTIFPLEVSASVVKYGELLLPVIGLAMAAALVARNESLRTAQAFLALAAGGAFSFGLLTLILRAQSGAALHVYLGAVVLDSATTAAAVLTLLWFGAGRFAACLVAGTALTILEGLIIERPDINIRIAAGTLLLVGSSALLLRTPKRYSGKSTAPLGL